ncbi:MAG: succinate dehydrogenase assembly factor 2 [Alphaproteobacteria bacterium]|nr:succinate dehydrogenase assembly factor 2 [Alphaproteobacteria bacterium]OJV12191.1 MAG: hypothetical protein BGO27_05580 [Alphaproteobacteria bacterium 33-17]
MSQEDQNRLKKIYYQSVHRGCKESDYVLTHFADHYLNELTDIELDIYEKFLLEEDVNIMNWVMGKEEVPSEYNMIFDKIMAGIDR